ncbi:hypothetical protein L210DRAFT_3556679 [Boletus edulis BED1]|uniref:Uncharacterized protein n=1 Tax=Boletus edulis BED1 TaxID=1328754 RepID=A0AAD4BK16_BOLED|nr:hypothetical protein L210DRAFT_3556679 [Boletus edulis BED1]
MRCSGNALVPAFCTCGAFQLGLRWNSKWYNIAPPPGLVTISITLSCSRRGYYINDFAENDWQNLPHEFLFYAVMVGMEYSQTRTRLRISILLCHGFERPDLTRPTFRSIAFLRMYKSLGAPSNRINIPPSHFSSSLFVSHIHTFIIIMRIASALVAFVFLRAAVAAVLVPDLNGGIAEHPSQPPPSLMGPKPSDAPIFPMSGGPEPSAPPSGAPNYPTPSHIPPPAFRRAEPIENPLPFPASYPPSFPSGAPAHPSQPLPPMKVDPSGKPLGSKKA